jgi:hypothetical protein
MDRVLTPADTGSAAPATKSTETPSKASSRIGLQTTLRVPHVAGSCRRAVASSRNGEYRGICHRHLSRRVRAAPCRRLHLPRVFSRSLPGRCAGGSAGWRPPDRGRRLHLSCRPGVDEIARRGSVTAGIRGAPAALVPSSKNADGPLPHPHHLPTLRFASTGHRAGVIPDPAKQCHSEGGAATDPAGSPAASAPTEESGGWAPPPCRSRPSARETVLDRLHRCRTRFFGRRSCSRVREGSRGRLPQNDSDPCVRCFSGSGMRDRCPPGRHRICRPLQRH